MWGKTLGFIVLLFACGVGTAAAYESQLAPYPDVAKADWGEESIYTLSAVGIVSGYPDGTFRPDDPVTREAFLKMLVTSWQDDSGAPAGGDDRPTLADVARDKWSAVYIERAYRDGMIDFMVRDGAFQPARDMTREEVAVVVGRELFGHLSEAERQQWMADGWQQERQARAFRDGGDFDAKQAVYAYLTAHNGIMIGDDAGTFRPQSPLTRREAAAILYRAIDVRTAGAKLAAMGFYAIKSSSDMDKMDALANVAFGWSHLAYDEPGKATLNTDATEYAFPDGWETAVEAAARGGAAKELMIYANNGGGKLDAFLNDEPAQRAFVASVAAVLARQPDAFDGVCADFEGLQDGNYKEQYTAFLHKLREAIGSRTLSVAVPPLFYYAGYDLHAIGELADRVIVMAYDFTHDPDRLPSAPLPLVSETLAAVLRDVPRSKTVLGIAKQANQWTTAPDGQTTSAGPSPDKVEQRLMMPGVQSQTGYPYFLRHIAFADERGAHEIWYEDAASVAKKLWLAKYYGLSGVSLWRMGLFTPQDWDVIRQQTQPAR